MSNSRLLRLSGRSLDFELIALRIAQLREDIIMLSGALCSTCGRMRHSELVLTPRKTEPLWTAVWPNGSNNYSLLHECGRNTRNTSFHCPAAAHI